MACIIAAALRNDTLQRLLELLDGTQVASEKGVDFLDAFAVSLDLLGHAHCDISFLSISLGHLEIVLCFEERGHSCVVKVPDHGHSAFSVVQNGENFVVDVVLR